MSISCLILASSSLALKELFQIHNIWLHLILQACMLSCFSHVQLYAPLSTVAHQAPLSMRFSRKDTEMGCHALLQGIFSTQGLNPGLPHGRRILYHLRHQGSPRILEWVAYPFSSGSSQPRNWTGVSCIAGGFFTNWTQGSPCAVKCTDITLSLYNHCLNPDKK